MTSDQLDDIVYQSQSDLHKVSKLSEGMDMTHDDISGDLSNDTFDDVNTSIQKIISQKMMPQEIILSASGMETTISLNLLDSATQVVSRDLWTKRIPWIYSHMVISDRMDSFPLTSIVDTL